MILTVTLNPSLDEWIYLERLVVGALNRSRAFGRYPGGKGINVSRVVHELGERTMAVALAGGADGRILSDLLHGRRIPHRFVTVPGATRNNYQIQSGSPRALTQINCPGPRASAVSLARVSRLIGRCARSARLAVLSGSLPPGAGPTTYRRLLAQLARLRLPAALDTSGPALAAGLAGRPWLIKPNRQEAEELTGRRLSRLSEVVDAARALVRRGPSHVVISLGAEGAVLASADAPEAWLAVPPKVRVESAVGAGDSLVAGFAVGWLASRSPAEALRLGSACGAATALTPGTELCHRRDVRRLLPRVKLRKLSD